jgi:flavin reductase (DIM6/NTAB) family NADH-FMN oxidoreductase RutF
LIAFPGSWKQRLRSVANFPRYGPVGLSDPQQRVQVWLHGLDQPIEVTRNNVVAALRPFTIGVMFQGSCPENLNGRPLRMCMHERDDRKRLLGAIHLRLARTIPLPEHCLCLFESEGCTNFCAAKLALGLYYLDEQRRAKIRQRKNPFNFLMTPEDVRCSHVFYICPRPVEFVTVEHEGASNMFPMDLIGPTDSPWFTMALRSTSPAVRLMQGSRRMALASVPLANKDMAYEMGKHHRKTRIDWSELPFRTKESPLFRLPVLEDAFRVREVEVKEWHEVGSHFLFITSVERETLSHPAITDNRLQLFHGFSSYRQYLAWL